jgi:hypothetical protein
MSDQQSGTHVVKWIGIVVMIMGLLMVVGGAVTYAQVSSTLAAEGIVVSEDAPCLGGQPVAGPFAAYCQADAIAHHALEATGGRTYAQLDRDDPLRDVAMTASFLRASLFTSVVAFGVAALAIGIGIGFVLVGFALLAIGGPARRRAEELTA